MKPVGACLAIDTSHAPGSICLGKDGFVLQTVTLTKPLHLQKALSGLLSEHNCPASALEHIAVCTGPGAYTGLRTGIAFCQALSMSTGASLTAVPTDLAMACWAWSEKDFEEDMVWVDCYADKPASLWRVAEIDGNDTQGLPQKISSSEIKALKSGTENVMQIWGAGHQEQPLSGRNTRSGPLASIAYELITQLQPTPVLSCQPVYIQPKTAWNKHPNSNN